MRRMQQDLKQATRNQDKGALSTRIEVAKDLQKELPRLRLAQTAAQVRLKTAEGKQAEDLKLELAVLDAQEKMINDHAKVLNNRIDITYIDIPHLDEEINQIEIVCRRLGSAVAELEIESRRPKRITVLQEAEATKN